MSLPDFVNQSNVNLTDRVSGFFGNETKYDNLVTSVEDMYNEVKEIDENIKVLGDEIRKDAEQVHADSIMIAEYGDRVLATSTDTKKWRDEALAAADAANSSKDLAITYKDQASDFASNAELSSTAADGFAHDAKLFANNALISEEESLRYYNMSYGLYEDLVKGQVYRGIWNPHSGSYPDAKGTNSVWDVILNENELEFTWNGIKWYWGDRLIYVHETGAYTQIESGLGGGVVSVNGKKGAVVINSDDVGALGKTGIAVAAKKLETPRLIAGKPFDGTKDITISYTDVGALGATDTEAGDGALMRVGGARDQEITKALDEIVGGAVISDTPPVDPKEGVTWFNTTDGQTYIWYVDPDGTVQWVDQNPDELIVENMGGVPLLSVMWFSDRKAIESGYVPADGQLVSKALYPEAGNKVAKGNVAVISDEEWIGEPLKRGNFTTGNATHFRVPDYNGRSPGSVGAPFMRGDGMGVEVGTITESQNKTHSHTRGDMNITGSVTTSNPIVEWGGQLSNVGALSMKGHGNLPATNFTSPSGQNGYNSISIDASKSWTGSTSSEGGPEARPLNVTGVWAIKVFDRMIDPSSIDVAEVTTELVRVQGELTIAEAKIAELEQWPQSGSNENGSWIKHRDGTLECILSTSDINDVNISTGTGSLFYTSGGFKEWTLPAPLISTENIHLQYSGAISSTGPNVPVFWSITRNNNTVGLYAGSTIKDEKAKLTSYSVRLTGRWK